MGLWPLPLTAVAAPGLPPALWVTALWLTTACAVPMERLASFSLHHDYRPTVAAHNGESSGILGMFTVHQQSVNISHVVVERHTGRVYVGGVNWLYQLNASLFVEASAQTGPVHDSRSCSAAETECQAADARLTNNFNKVLLIDHSAHKLIACGSVRQGSCRRHDLADITHQEPLVETPVAANDQNSSTVAFIGPSKYDPNGLPVDVLYVAATNTKSGPYRDMVPAIASRTLRSEQGRVGGAIDGVSDLDGLFTVVESSFSETARVDISSNLRDAFLVHYVFGFHHRDFAHFALIQRRSYLVAHHEWGYESRLARVCVSDPAYNTYVEVSLQCVTPEGTNYNLLTDATLVDAGVTLLSEYKLSTHRDSTLFIGAFVQSEGPHFKESRRSAVCIFPMVEIERRFQQNIHRCYNGSTLTRNMHYIAGSVNECPELGGSGNVVNFCKETVKLNGSIPIVARPVATFSDETLTGVGASLVEKQNVIFVGTASGRLHALLVEEKHYSRTFHSVLLERGVRILPQIFVHDTATTEKYLIVASLYKVFKLALSDCAKHTTCGDCMEAKNPYCGWCALENKCNSRWECGAITGTSQWLSSGTDRCPYFEAIIPPHIPIQQNQVTLELLVSALPPLPFKTHYVCVFGGRSKVQAHTTHSGLACTIPEPPLRPQIPAGKGAKLKCIILKFSLFLWGSSTHLCKSCVMSQWSCSWCLVENSCTSNTSTCSQRKIIGEASSEVSLIKGRQHCPSFHLEDRLLIPHEAKQELAIQVKNLLAPVTESFQCVIELENRRLQVLARKRGDFIVCSESSLSYEADEPEVEAQLTVLWNGDIFVDQTNLTVYKCGLLGSHSRRADCSLCLTRDARYQCSWCGSQCMFGPSCSQPVTTSCPPPRIDWIHPLSGPVEGGTLVTIEGSNLGTSQAEVEDKIRIGQLPCVPREYSVSVRVVCETQPNPHGPQEAFIYVGNSQGLRKAQEKFHYKEIELTGVYPRVGPQSGGTRIYLNGTNLNVGSNVSVMLDDIPCIVERSLASSGQLSCRTSRAPLYNYKVEQLILQVDGARLILPHPFVFVEDPNILDIRPLRSYQSGGREILVRGEFLDSVQQPRMAVFDPGDNDNKPLNETTCSVVNSTLMICPSPFVLGVHKTAGHQSDQSSQSQASMDRHTKANLEEGEQMKLGFIMDRVVQLKQLDVFFPMVDSMITYLRDPVLFTFGEAGAVKAYKGDTLVIEGDHLLGASEQNEVRVYIGTSPCNVTSLTSSQIVCLPPADSPAATDQLGRRTALPKVTVQIGSNLLYSIGYLRYEMSKLYNLPPEIMGMAATGGAILILVSVLVLALLRHKNSQAEREYKRIQLQMATLENSVRSECKQAFAELQTDLKLEQDTTDNELGKGFGGSLSPPVLSHTKYLENIFFPGVPNTNVFHIIKPLNNAGCSNHYEVAMANFELLVNNKTFLLTFIDTLERQNTFSIRDKVNVASLLMVILLDKMDYATEILRDLLVKLIDKYAETKHPQLMLRRTESVVEKMLSNWLSVCMYERIAASQARPMFLLLRALKQQLEKGPVDAVTHDARYSLAEERLLREQINYSAVVLHVRLDKILDLNSKQDDPDDRKSLVVRVNDCDTISQTKRKILDVLFVNVPFSQRPTVNSVELEWHHGQGPMPMLLSDIDATSVVQDGLRRLNTLIHYGVADSAVVTLIHRNANYETLSRLNKQQTDQSACWHLVPPAYVNDGHLAELRHKNIAEIYLTRLLSTKGTIQSFIDDFFASILTATDELPLAVKWLFDLFDESACQHVVQNSEEVAQAWKSNSLPLRFWVNMLKNPDFVFDIEKSSQLDASLSVIAQSFMDACAQSEQQLSKNSPSSKLLFAKDIPQYRKLIDNFYRDIASMPPVPDHQLALYMRQLSVQYAGQVDTTNALKDLYIYAAKYNSQILAALEDREGGTLGDYPPSGNSLVNRLRVIEASYRAGTLKRFT
ncbi:plexin-B-like [Varroa jacobsoni]|uniref:plexin-B-like n=1 Tax=Varroa jacobsoni TaxID=62625 RepID=UPI000BFA6ECB|nr:plexin-B-like [Varroa jacobsoni]